jgi:hypothetical protein
MQADDPVRSSLKNNQWIPRYSLKTGVLACPSGEF